MRTLRNILMIPALWLATTSLTLAGDSASGTITFKNGKCVVKHGWLVRGPDDMDPSITVLRLYLSDTDGSAAAKACKTFSCADRSLKDGAMVDYGDARHLGFAVRLNDERLQYSGGTNSEAFILTTSEPNRLAGKLQIDKTAAGGAKIDVTFDLTVINTVATTR